MNEYVTNEIPEYLREEIVYCDNLTQSPKHRSWLVLLSNLTFYEFQRKVAINSIDLSSTCFMKVLNKLENYKGVRGKLHYYHKDSMSCDENRTFLMAESDVYFGKYIYQNYEVRKLFLLIKCWDKLVVIELSNSQGLSIVAEYDEIASFKIVHGKIKFQAAVQIRFLDGSVVKTDFHEHSQISCDKTMKHDRFKQLLERIHNAKTELLVHKSITQKEFYRLKNTQTFGCNFIRSSKLEEKMILVRCGDIWVRLISGDEVVIGVPILNNVSEPTSLLKNIKPVFQTTDAVLNYRFRLYKLKQRFVNFESVETFFKGEAYDLEPNTWSEECRFQLGPETFAVLCIKLQISEIISLAKVPLFVFFSIERDITINEIKSFNFQQHIFIKEIDFNFILMNRRPYEITFKKNTLHQDLLSIAMTSIETSIGLTFRNVNDMRTFEELLTQKFDFAKLEHANHNPVESLSDDLNMEVDDEQKTEVSETNTFSHYLYYNHKESSIWFSVLVVHYIRKDTINKGIRTKWKFYTKSEGKTCLLLQLIFTDLAILKSNVIDIEYPLNNKSDMHVITFENRLRKELSGTLSNRSQNSETQNSEELNTALQTMLQLELQTDLLAQSLLN